VSDGVIGEGMVFLGCVWKCAAGSCATALDL